MSRLGLATLLAAVSLAGPAVAAETIVGRWGETSDVCRSASVVVLGPMRLASDETVCNFDDVSRRGDVVTWKGNCAAGDVPPEPETVIATLAGGRLTLRFRGSGASIGPLIRCR